MSCSESRSQPYDPNNHLLPRFERMCFQNGTHIDLREQRFEVRSEPVHDWHEILLLLCYQDLFNEPLKRLDIPFDSPASESRTQVERSAKSYRSPSGELVTDRAYA